jgi:hypothetical protein
MTNPTQQTFLDSLRAALGSDDDLRNVLLNSRAPASQSFTPAESMHIVERWARALNNLPRYPITTAITHHPDGHMTITVTPHTT